MQYGLIALQINQSIPISTVIPDLSKCGVLKWGFMNQHNPVIQTDLADNLRQLGDIEKGAGLPPPPVLTQEAILRSPLWPLAD